MDKILLARQRYGDFTVNYENKKYKWNGIKGNIISKKEVPMDVFDYLQSSTSTFQDGELVVIDDKKTKKDKEEILEILENIPDADEYEANTHSRDEVVELLKGNVNKMKSELKKITSQTEKRFIMDVAKELVEKEELDSLAKQKFLVVEFLGSNLSPEDYFEL